MSNELLEAEIAYLQAILLARRIRAASQVKSTDKE